MAGRTGRKGQIVTPQDREFFLKHLEDPSGESSLSSPDESSQQVQQQPTTKLDKDKRPKRSSRKTSRQSRAADKAPAVVRAAEQEHEEGCRMCGKDDDHDKLLICETCSNEFHFYCLDPPLKAVPSGDWFCDKCKPKLPTGVPEDDDGLEALVCALPPRYTERFGEIVWAQGGVGFGWWPACIYDPRLTVGGARELARKNLGRKHLAYFFECHEAPFAVVPEAKLMQWEKGLVEDYHMGKAAHSHGKARGMLFRQALHIATMEDAKPIDNRMVWNHTGDEVPRVDEGPETPWSPIKRQHVPSSSKRKRGRPSKQKSPSVQPDTKSKRKRRSPDSDVPKHPASPGSVKRTNLLHAIAVHSSPTRKGEPQELFCRVLKRETDASDNEVDVRLGFITLESHDATFEDARDLILSEMDPQCLPGETWKFYLPSLGPVSHRQEQRLGPVVKFLNKTFGRKLGDGTIENPLHLVLIAVP